MSREGTQDRIEEAGDWRPQSLRTPAPPWLTPRQRVVVLAAVVLGHLALAWWLPWLDRHANSRPDEALLVTFIERPALSPPPPEVAVPGAEAVPEPRKPPPRRRRARPESTQPLQVQSLPRPSERAPLELYDENGRLKVPKDMLEQIDRKFGDTRTFSYQIPGMERAEKLLNRPPPITYESTRFDEYWKPDQDLLTSLLTQMVEKTTKEIRVPVPGRSHSTMVCKVSLLALGGGCGVLTPGSDYVGPVDDPDTLSPEEDRQCQKWWEQIVGATTQDTWRRTRKLYEAQCRKPKERAPSG
jgi:hypothetical protein